MATLERLLESVREGASRALVLRGEAGVGKTALLDFAVSAAPDMKIARLAAVEFEMQLGFAALHQLLFPFLDGLHRLPGPQRAALGSAFGLTAGPAPDRFLVSVAALTMIADVAAEQPVLCVIDDAQWLDGGSGQALGFVARRLFADRVGMLFAIRDGEGLVPDLASVPELKLGALPDDAAAELLATVLRGPIDEVVRRRVIAEAGGNPLALIELGSELTPGGASGTEPLPSLLRLPDRLEQLFRSRLHALPGETQQLILLAAADPSGEPGLFWRAAERLRLSRAALDVPAVDQILKLGSKIEFRHPLMRSAAYYGLSAADRRRAHEALAASSDPDRDADRRAWHLAAATAGPDETVAAELERTAERPRKRGGWASAADLLARSAELTPNVARQAERALASAQARLLAGDPAAARLILNRATPLLDDPLSRAHAKRLEGTICFALGTPAAAATSLLTAVQMLVPLDPRLARDALFEAFDAAHLAGRFANGASVPEVLNVARSAPPVDEHGATLGDRLLDGFASLDESGEVTGVPLLRRAIVGSDLSQPFGDRALRFLPLAWSTAAELYDDRALQALSSRWLNEARDGGSMTSLPLALGRAPVFDVWAGRIANAIDGFAEVRELASATGTADRISAYGAGELLAYAWQGRESETREAASALEQDLLARDRGIGIRMVNTARTVLELGLGNYEEALRAALNAYDEDSLFRLNFEPELIEAAVRSGRADVAEGACARLERRAHAVGSDWGLGMLFRSQALLADDQTAEPLYAASIEHLGRTLILPQLGRSHLLYGEWLRRQRRRRDAREQLRSAYDILNTIGADAFAARARVELLATGGKARKRQVESRDQLTPQEKQVVKLASAGASNQEIAAQLFISASTVAYHLTKAFRKLDVPNRASLARALEDNGLG